MSLRCATLLERHQQQSLTIADRWSQMLPSSQPSAQPSSQPSAQPSAQPSSQPSSQPSLQPIARNAGVAPAIHQSYRPVTISQQASHYIQDWFRSHECTETPTSERCRKAYISQACTALRRASAVRSVVTGTRIAEEREKVVGRRTLTFGVGPENPETLSCT